MGNLRKLHPSMQDDDYFTTEALTERILESRLQREVVLTWAIGLVSACVVTGAAGVVFAIWRLALSIQTGA